MTSQATAPETSAKKRRLGSLRTRSGLALGGAMLVLILIFVGAISSLLVVYFGGLQDQILSTRVQRLVSVLEQSAKAKIRLVRNSAEWDDTWNFLHGSEPNYLEKNYAPAVNSSGQDLVMVFTEKRQLAGSLQTRPGDDLTGVPAGLSVEDLAASKVLGTEATAGLLRVEKGVLFLAACPVRPTDLSKEASGWLIFGTYLDEDRLADVEEMSGMKLSVVSRSEQAAGSPMVEFEASREFFKNVKISFPTAVSHGEGEDLMHIFLRFASMIHGEPIFVRAATEVSIYRDAIRTRNWIVVLSILGGLTLMVVSFIVVELVVIRPLAEIDRQMELLSEDETQGGLLTARRDDEIGRLALSANRLFQLSGERQRKAEEQKELIDSILDSANEGVVAYRACRNQAGAIVDFEIVESNRAAEQMVHMEKSDVLGRKMCEMFPKLATSGILGHYIRVAESRQPHTFEIFYEGHNITGWLRFSVAPWGDGVVVTFEDIGERKNQESKLAKSYQEARMAEQEAARASEAKSTFLAMMSHEIRTPLNGVIGFTDLLLEEGLPDRQSRITEAIRTCGQTLLTLINDILDISRIESDHLLLEPVDGDIFGCVRSVMATFEPVAAKSGITLTLVADEAEHHWWRLDFGRFRQIIFNLVGNAVKFTPGGTITIRLWTESGGEASRIHCSVTDSGRGISPEDLGVIFEPFLQGQGARQATAGGSGLGLAISRKLIEAMGGTIKGTSQLGEGSCFTFDVLAEKAGPPQLSPGTMEAGVRGAGVNVGTKILVVDDVELNLRVAESLLQRLGCSVEVAHGGEEAIKKAKETMFDVIFMDVLMPGIDGLETSRRLRIETTAARPFPLWIIALTADAMEENRQRCLAAGMDDFLTKPLRLRDMESALQRWVEEKAGK